MSNLRPPFTKARDYTHHDVLSTKHDICLCQCTLVMNPARNLDEALGNIQQRPQDQLSDSNIDTGLYDVLSYTQSAVIICRPRESC